MTTQTNYSTNIAPPEAGTVAGGLDNSRITAGICETASPGIPFGRAVSQGTLSDAGRILGGTLAGFKGISVKDVTLRGDLSVLDAYLPPNSMSVLEEGDIWVTTGEAVAANDPVCFDLATGILYKATGSGKSALMSGAYFKTSAGSGGQAIVFIPAGRKA